MMKPMATRMRARLTKTMRQQTPLVLGQKGLGADMVSTTTPALVEFFPPPAPLVAWLRPLLELQKEGIVQITNYGNLSLFSLPHSGCWSGVGASSIVLDGIDIQVTPGAPGVAGRVVHVDAGWAAGQGARTGHLKQEGYTWHAKMKPKDGHTFDTVVTAPGGLGLELDLDLLLAGSVEERLEGAAGGSLDGSSLDTMARVRCSPSGTTMGLSA